MNSNYVQLKDISYETVYRLALCSSIYNVIPENDEIKAAFRTLLASNFLESDISACKEYRLKKDFIYNYLGYSASLLLYSNTHWRRSKYSKYLKEFTFKMLEQLDVHASIYDKEVQESVENLLEIMDIYIVLKTVRSSIRGGYAVSKESNRNSIKERSDLTRIFLLNLYKNFQNGKFETFKPLKPYDLKKYYKMEIPYDAQYESFWLRHYSRNPASIRDSVFKEIFSSELNYLHM